MEGCQLMAPVKPSSSGPFDPRLEASNEPVAKGEPSGSVQPEASPPVQLKPAPWVGKPSASRPIEHQLMDAAASFKPAIDEALTTAVRAPSQGEAILKPAELLKHVSNGDLSITLPMLEGEVIKGPLGMELASALRNTSVKLVGRVRNGQVDLDALKLSFEPPLDGPLWVEVPKLSIQKGRVTLTLKGFPDIKVGPKLAAPMADFVSALEQVPTSPTLDVGFLGLDFSIKTPEVIKTITDLSTSFIDKDRPASALFEVKNVTFDMNRVPLGGGSMHLDAGTRAQLSGTLEHLRLTAKGGFRGLHIDQDGVEVKGGKGSAAIDVQYLKTGQGMGAVLTRLDKLNLQVESAVSRRTNGDVLELGQGRLKGGSISLRTKLMGNGVVPTTPTSAVLERLSIEEFEGTLTGARLTIPDGKDTAQVQVESGRMKGSLTIDDERILLNGKLDVNGQILDYQSETAPDGTFVDAAHIGLRGGGVVNVDTSRGMSMDGSVNMSATFNPSKLGVEIAEGSRVTIDTQHFDANRSKLVAKGSGQAELRLANVEVGAAGVTLKAEKATLQGAVSNVRLDSSQGLFFAKTNKLALNAKLSGGQVSFGDTIQLNLNKGGVGFESVLTEAAFGGGRLQARFAKGTTLEAKLEEGSISVDDKKVQLGAGTAMRVEFDDLFIDSQGLPTAQGRLGLVARLGNRELDLPTVEALTGTKLTAAEVLRVDSKFSIHPDKTFELEHLQFTAGLEGGARSLKGKL